MANRNLADEVDALAKGLASLRVANKRTVSRVAALEDRQLQALIKPAANELANIDLRYALQNALKKRAAIPESSLLSRIRAWWAR